MTAEDIRTMLETRPFRPFWVLKQDGNGILISKPECAALPPGKGLVAFAKDDKVHFIKIEEIIQIVV
jgi:hypothetical protein